MAGSDSPLPPPASKKHISGWEVGGQEIHQEAVKLSAECVEELAGNVAGHQLGSPELHWEDASRGEGAVKLSEKLPGSSHRRIQKGSCGHCYTGSS